MRLILTTSRFYSIFILRFENSVDVAIAVIPDVQINSKTVLKFKVSLQKEKKSIICAKTRRRDPSFYIC